MPTPIKIMSDYETSETSKFLKLKKDKNITTKLDISDVEEVKMSWDGPLSKFLDNLTINSKNYKASLVSECNNSVDSN